MGGFHGRVRNRKRCTNCFVGWLTGEPIDPGATVKSPAERPSKKGRPADNENSPVENADGNDDNDVEATVREAMLTAPKSAMKAVRMARESLGGGSFIDGSEGEVERLRGVSENQSPLSPRER